MKQKVLHHIYEEFEDWAQNISFACKKGCDTCCTQNVTITEVEASLILNKIIAEKKEVWFAEKLQIPTNISAPAVTTNEYAAACFNSKEIDVDTNTNFEPCPFLENNTCTIYEVRPFACRCFASTEPCNTNKHATAPEHYLSASTAIHQLIEHLDQGWYWGNMFDVLLVMSQMQEYKTIGYKITNNELLVEAKLRVRPASPLPGFLLLEEEQPLVNPLLEKIFSKKIDHRTIEDILNGK